MFDIIFSVIQWTRLEALRGRFWALGRMFDAPALDHQQKMIDSTTSVMR